jgi:hypothetical protein
MGYISEGRFIAIPLVEHVGMFLWEVAGSIIFILWFSSASLS